MAHSLSLRAKILLTIIVLTLSTLAFVTTIFTTNSLSQYRNLIPFLFETINQSNAITSAMSTNNLPVAEDALQNLQANPNIAYADVFYKNALTKQSLANNTNLNDADKETLTSFNQNLELDKPTLFFQKKDLELIYPFKKDNQMLGITYVKAQPPGNTDALTFFEVILLIAIIATYVAMRLEAVIAKPLLSLVSTMKEVTINNDYSLRVKKISQDEVGVLVDTFNSMLEKIQLNEKLQRTSQEQIKKLAYYDSLTGLPNRDFYKILLQQLLRDAKQNKTMLAVLAFNLDNFKLINDKFGQAAGDVLLQKVANNIQQCLQETNPGTFDNATNDIARLSGDEFVITLRNLQSIHDAEELAKKILALNRKPYQLDGQNTSLTASIGIAVYPTHCDNYETLLKYADTALYCAKEKGKDCYEIFNEQAHTVIMDKVGLEHELREAFQKHELMLYFQPKFDIKANKISGLETLLRWKHPEKGFISPEEFIPIAEKTGLIIEIGTWVLKEACKRCKAMQQSGFPNLNLAVNLSARQFYDSAITTILRQALTESKLDPHNLELELTESMVMMNDTVTLDRLYELKAVGVKLSIDDFGTGYSSLRYLSRYPIDSVKVDKSFVAHLLENKNNAIITKTIIDLAHNLNLTVIAEGVETQAQFDYLKQNKCDEIQGFLISKPLPENELMSLIKTRENVYAT